MINIFTIIWDINLIQSVLKHVELNLSFDVYDIAQKLLILEKYEKRKNHTWKTKGFS